MTVCPSKKGKASPNKITRRTPRKTLMVRLYHLITNHRLCLGELTATGVRVDISHEGILSNWKTCGNKTSVGNIRSWMNRNGFIKVKNNPHHYTHPHFRVGVTEEELMNLKCDVIKTTNHCQHPSSCAPKIACSNVPLDHEDVKTKCSDMVFPIPSFETSFWYNPHLKLEMDINIHNNQEFDKMIDEYFS